MIERRQSFHATSSSFDAHNGEQVDVLGGPPEEVGHPLYVGQSPRLLTRGTTFEAQW